MAREQPRPATEPRGSALGGRGAGCWRRGGSGAAGGADAGMGAGGLGRLPQVRMLHQRREPLRLVSRKSQAQVSEAQTRSAGQFRGGQQLGRRPCDGPERHLEAEGLVGPGPGEPIGRSPRRCRRRLGRSDGGRRRRPRLGAPRRCGPGPAPRRAPGSASPDPRGGPGRRRRAPGRVGRSPRGGRGRDRGRQRRRPSDGRTRRAGGPGAPRERTRLAGERQEVGVRPGGARPGCGSGRSSRVLTKSRQSAPPGEIERPPRPASLLHVGQLPAPRIPPTGSPPVRPPQPAA